MAKLQLGVRCRAALTAGMACLVVHACSNQLDGLRTNDDGAAGSSAAGADTDGNAGLGGADAGLDDSDAPAGGNGNNAGSQGVAGNATSGASNSGGAGGSGGSADAGAGGLGNGGTSPVDDASMQEPQGSDAGLTGDAGVVGGAGSDVDSGAAPDCSGFIDHALCWHLGDVGESCEATCVGRGGTHPDAEQIVGIPAQGGSAEVCESLLAGLGVTTSVVTREWVDGQGLGCHVIGGQGWWLEAPAFDASASAFNSQLVCACEW